MNDIESKPPNTSEILPQPPQLTPPVHYSSYNFSDDVNRPVPGWPSLARVIADHPEFEAFPSFSDLAIKSLLYYHVELISLRKDLHKAEWADYRDLEGGDLTRYAENLSLLIAAREKAIQDNTQLPQQWILMQKIRTTLDQYSQSSQTSSGNITNPMNQIDAALQQLSNVSDFMKADNGNVQSLKECVKHFCSRGPLEGDGASTWGNTHEKSRDWKSLWARFYGLFTSIFVPPDLGPHPTPFVFQEDLIFPRQGSKPPDSLTLWVLHSFIPFYGHLRRSFLSLWYRQRGIEKQSTIHSEKILTSYYSPHYILRFTFVVITVVACLLPTVAIIVLAKVNSKDLILKLLTAFTAIFALGLIFLSSSSTREQIFLATIGYASFLPSRRHLELKANKNHTVSLLLWWYLFRSRLLHSRLDHARRQGKKGLPGCSRDMFKGVRRLLYASE